MRRSEFLSGKGEAGLDTLFPEGSPTAGIPFPKALGSARAQAVYDMDKVRDVARDPHHPLTDVDPNDPRLRSMQPHVTNGGVRHYMSEEYDRTGATYDQSHQAGNVTPVVYHVPAQDHRGEEMVLMSGHHRATAALLQGRQFRARVVEGPWKDLTPPS